MKPCVQLDYEEGKFGPDIELKDCAPHYPQVRYWERGPVWTEGGGAAKVQFCKRKGRVAGIFGCYNGEMPCYDPGEGRSKPAKGE